MPLTAGTVIGPYKITTLIGAGGMGVVYQAEDANLGRQVAIKVLPDDLAADGERLARFEREARTLAALNHPNIASVYGLERSGSHPALVMELVEGPTLADRIAGGAIPIDEAVPIAIQIADALEAAHAAGIIHRDLKPANIKIRPDDGVKVLDFGLAKSIDRDSSIQSVSPTITSPAMTRAGVVLGTAAYMSPEQARGHVADKRSDIWSFGCVLFEMLAGRRAFGSGDDTVSDTIANVLKGEPDWRALPADTPAPLIRLLSRCLAKDRRERLHDIADARLELRDARVSDQSSVSQPRTSKLSWSLGVVAAALAVALAVTLTRDRRATAPAAFATRSVILPPVDGDAVNGPVIPRFGRGVALSADGRRLAFVAPGRDGRVRLWVRAVDALSAQALAGTEGASNPFWSPDGAHLGFIADRTLKRIDLDGGSITPLARDVNVFSTGSWNQSDDILFARDRSILRVGARGGDATIVTTAESGAADVSPFFLPDGQHFVFAVSGEGGIVGRSIALGRLGSTDVKTLRAGGSFPAVANGYLLFLANDAVMAQRFDSDRLEVVGEETALPDRVQIGGGPGIPSTFSVSQSGQLVYQDALPQHTELVWVDRSGVEKSVLGHSLSFSNPQISPDGRYVAVAVRDAAQRNRDIWIYDAVRGGRTIVTTEPSDDFSPVWSPDGSQVLYTAPRGGIDTGLDLYVRNASGTNDHRVLDRKGVEIPTSWSRDGKFVLFQTQSPGNDVYMFSFENSKVEPIATGQYSESGAQFSPDGQWIAYASEETGRSEVYLLPFRRAGPRVPVSTEGGALPRWRADGRELYFVRRDGGIAAVDIRLAASGVEIGATRLLFPSTLRGGPNVNYAVAANGQSFLLNRATEDTGSQPLTLVTNWPASVAK